MNVTVREATVDDGEGLLDLWQGFTDRPATFDERYGAKESADDRWLSYFDNQSTDSTYGVVLLAEDEAEEPLGVLEVRIVGERPIFRLDRHGEIYGMFVREGARGQGVGRALLDAAESWFAEAPRDVDFYRIGVAEGGDAAAVALGELDRVLLTHRYEGRIG